MQYIFDKKEKLGPILYSKFKTGDGRSLRFSKILVHTWEEEKSSEATSGGGWERIAPRFACYEPKNTGARGARAPNAAKTQLVLYLACSTADCMCCARRYLAHSSLCCTRTSKSPCCAYACLCLHTLLC